MSNLMFKNWKARCSSLGHLLTCLPQPITQDEIAELDALLKELESGVNANGNKTKWTDTKKSRTESLKKKKKGEDELPPGAITHLEDVFRSQFWGRRRILANKYLDKGNFNEDDAIGLLSDHHDKFFKKNKEQFSDDFIQGMMDIIEELFDTKANWDKKTHDEAELTTLYAWQIRGYAKLLKRTSGTLAYCLVNSSLDAIEKERKSLYFQMNCPDEEDENWIAAVQQIERNHIYDIPAFQKAYPHYIFANKKLDFTIPAILRVKEFPVTLTEKDIEDIERRVMMARVYLCEKEAAVYKLCPELQIKAVEYYENLKQTA